MEFFGAMSNAVISKPVQSWVDSRPKKRRNTQAGVGPQMDIPADWDGNIATLVEAQAMEDSLIATTASTDTDNVCQGNITGGRG